jgi:hypothetical protein
VFCGTAKSAPDFRKGSKCDIADCLRHVWFGPNTGHPADALSWQLCAGSVAKLDEGWLARNNRIVAMVFLNQ